MIIHGGYDALMSDKHVRIDAKISAAAYDQFNRELVASGLKPECIADLHPITMQLGFWIGQALLRGEPLAIAIAEFDEFAGTPLETLLEACTTNAERVRTIMLKAALDAFAMCCESGRVIEAITFVVQTMYGVTMSATMPDGRTTTIAPKDTLPT